MNKVKTFINKLTNSPFLVLIIFIDDLLTALNPLFYIDGFSKLDNVILSNILSQLLIAIFLFWLIRRINLLNKKQSFLKDQILISKVLHRFNLDKIATFNKKYSSEEHWLKDVKNAYNNEQKLLTEYLPGYLTNRTKKEIDNLVSEFYKTPFE